MGYRVLRDFIGRIYIYIYVCILERERERERQRETGRDLVGLLDI